MGALLRGIKREEIRRGQVLAAPGSIKSATKFLAQLYVRQDFEFFYFLLVLMNALDPHQGRRWSLYSIHATLQASVLHSYC
jgi:hypothetical protein